MNLNDRNIWKESSGDGDRNYAAICVRNNVILNGPGWSGKYPDCIAKMRADGTSERKLTDLRRFAEEMQVGALVVLRMGTKSVKAIGEVVGDYQWNDTFGDVDGWEIQNVRRVSPPNT